MSCLHQFNSLGSSRRACWILFRLDEMPLFIDEFQLARSGLVYFELQNTDRRYLSVKFFLLVSKYTLTKKQLSFFEDELQKIIRGGRFI